MVKVGASSDFDSTSITEFVNQNLLLILSYLLLTSDRSTVVATVM